MLAVMAGTFMDSGSQGPSAVGACAQAANEDRASGDSTSAPEAICSKMMPRPCLCAVGRNSLRAPVGL